MRRQSRRQNLLQEYGLEASTSLRLAARSEQHDLAHMRMRREDVQALRKQPGALSSPITALFSTRDAREPVSLRPSETLYVRLPAETEGETEETEGEAEAETTETKTGQTKTAQTNTAQTKTAKVDATEEEEGKPHPKQRYTTAARRRVPSVWTPLRLVAHHSYVAGMRVSGIVHRAIVRVEFDKA
jgi:hypothetical protein